MEPGQEPSLPTSAPMFIKHVTQHLAHNQYPDNVSYDYSGKDEEEKKCDHRKKKSESTNVKIAKFVKKGNK